MAGTTTDVTVAIVHYDTPDLLLGCLRSLADSIDSPGLQVIVVDNASRRFDPDACREVIPGLTVLRNADNVGVARAANQALRMATGRYLLLLNPDAAVAPETLRVMVDYMDGHPSVGCSTARVALPDGRLDLACRRQFPTPERAFYRLTYLSRLLPRNRRAGAYNLGWLDESVETEIDAPCGAFMLVRRETASEIGLLDERYFLYGEDLDWAFRMKAAGW